MKKLMISIVALLVAASAGAALIASDNASDSAYDPADNWTTGDNGGTGFEAWTLNSEGNNSGHFIGDSTSLSTPGADINVSSESFGMYGHTGEESDATRDFTGALSVGQIFSIALAVNWRNGAKGIDLQDSSNGTLFNFNVTGDDYKVDGISIGNSWSDNAEFLLEFAQTSAGAGTWTITRSGDVSDLDSGTYTGVADGFKLYNADAAGSNAESNLYVNSMQVVPEPAIVGMLGLGALLTLLIRRMTGS